MVETQNQTTKIQTLSSTKTTQVNSPRLFATSGLARGMKKSLFQAIEKNGGILKYRNKSGTREQLLCDLLDTLDGYGPKGTKPRRQATQCCNYWYSKYCNNEYDALYKKFDIQPLVTTIDRLEKTNKKTEEEETEEAKKRKKKPLLHRQ